MSDLSGIGRVQSAFRQRDFDQSRKQRIEAQLHVFNGTVTTLDAGEALFDVDFPVTFVDEPHVVGSGYKLNPAGSVALELNNYPTLSVGVHHFVTETVGVGTLHYVGAQLIIVSSGHTGIIMDVHYTMTGTALVSPGVLNGGLA